MIVVTASDENGTHKRPRLSVKLSARSRTSGSAVHTNPYEVRSSNIPIGGDASFAFIDELGN